MTAFADRGGFSLRLLLVSACCTSALLTAALPTPAQAADPAPTGSTAGDTVTVNLDQARILKLPERTATLVVGNPLIADAVVQPGGVVVVTAKSYGATNLVALDRAGVTLMDSTIMVVSPGDPVVVVYRGVDRETYSCMPNCERRITLGDGAAYFTATISQSGTLSGAAQGGAQPQR